MPTRAVDCPFSKKRAPAKCSATFSNRAKILLNTTISIWPVRAENIARRCCIRRCANCGVDVFDVGSTRCNPYGYFISGLERDARTARQGKAVRLDKDGRTVDGDTRYWILYLWALLVRKGKPAGLRRVRTRELYNGSVTGNGEGRRDSDLYRKKQRWV